jgi:hypothetical protein
VFQNILLRKIFVPTKDGVRNVEDQVIINFNYLYKSKTA